jgi:hemin uptake protein HemP
MKIPLVVGHETDEHPEINNQKCQNWIPVAAGPESKVGGVLLPTPGLKGLGSVSNDPVRALIEFEGILYAVVGNKFYSVVYNKVAETVAYTLISSINTSTGYLRWDSNVSQIAMVDSRALYIYEPSTSTFTINPDVDFLGARNIVFMDSYFFFNVPDTALVYATDVNDGSTISALDVTTAEFKNDNVVTVTTYNGMLWMMGKKTIEVYQNTANPAGFPFSPLSGAVINQGCGAPDSVVVMDERLIFLDDRGFFVEVQQFNLKILANENISKEVQRMDDFSDFFAYTYTEDGHTYYVAISQTNNKCYVYDAATGLWHTRTQTNASEEQAAPRITSHIRFGNDNLVGDKENGQIYRMSRDYLDDDGRTVQRVKITKNLNDSNRLFEISHLIIDATTGLAAEDIDPKIQIRTSYDRGRSWSNARILSLGKSGEYAKQIDDWMFGTDRNFMFEITISDPIDISLIDMEIETGVSNIV